MISENGLEALDMAVKHRNPPAGVVFHSDRGTQGGRPVVREAQDTPLPGRYRDFLDDSVAESWLAAYKKQLVHTRPWPAIAASKKKTFARVEECSKRTRRRGVKFQATLTRGARRVREMNAARRKDANPVAPGPGPLGARRRFPKSRVVKPEPVPRAA